jgi:hypothetical protein
MNGAPLNAEMPGPVALSEPGGWIGHPSMSCLGFGQERAQIGGSGVWLSGIVFDLSQSQSLELGDEFA